MYPPTQRRAKKRSMSPPTSRDLRVSACPKACEKAVDVSEIALLQYEAHIVVPAGDRQCGVGDAECSTEMVKVHPRRLHGEELENEAQLRPRAMDPQKKKKKRTTNNESNERRTEMENEYAVRYTKREATK